VVRIVANPEKTKPFATVFGERAPRFTPELADIWRTLFASRGGWRVERASGSSIWTLFWPPLRRSSGWWLCSGGLHSVAVTLVADDWCHDIGARDWSEYTGESRPIAWSAAHEALVEHLGALLGDAVKVSRESTALPPPLRVVRVGFRVAADEGSADGLLALPVEAAQVLASDSLRRRQSACPSHFADLALPMGVWLRDIEIGSGNLGAMAYGDILIVGQRDALSLAVRLESGQGRSWRAVAQAHIEGARLVIDDARFIPLHKRTEDHDMTDESEDNKATADGEKATGEEANESGPDKKRASSDTVGQANIPVRVDLQLGDVALTVGELTSIQPGYVIDLEQKLEEASVDLYVAGQRVGRGQMVAIGDSLGVHIREIGLDGVG